MNVAEAFPARRQPDGTIWYRSGRRANDGWSPGLEHAHPDYRAPGAPEPIDFNPAELNYRPPTKQDIELMASAVGLKFDETVLFYPPVPDAELPEITINGHDVRWPQAPDCPWCGKPHAPQTWCSGVTPAPGSVTTIEATFTDVNPDFIALLQPEETPPVTAINENFEIYTPPRWTEHMHYPLPPAPPRATIVHGQWGWYRLPHPVTGLPTGYPRATTIADTLDEQTGLNKWKRRETAKRIYELSQMPPQTRLNEFVETTAASALAAIGKAMKDSKVTTLDNTLEVIDDLMGGAAARELGECVHAWIEALALGMVLLHDVPAMVRPHIDAARAIMRHRGIIAVPEYVERVVLNERGDEVVAGRIDCIWEIVTTGDRVIGDVKTSESLERSWLSFGVQVGGVYGWATKVLALDGKGWLPMPKLVGVPHPDDHKADCPLKIKPDLWTGDVCGVCKAVADDRDPYAILLHVPRDAPEHAAAITINQTWSGEVMAEALHARGRRKEAKNQVPKHAIPAPSDEAIRTVEARLALSAITTVAEGQAVYETYQDVWNDDLGEFAEKISELL